MIIKSIIQELNKHFSKGYNNLIPKAIIKGKEIKLHNNFDNISTKSINKKLCFIDGGNLNLISSADFSLDLIRIYYTIYQGNKRIISKKFEFYCLTIAEYQNNEIIFKTKTFPETIEELTFSSSDKTLQNGITKAKVSQINPIIRRLTELKTASEVVDEETIIVLDGGLHATFTYEEKYVKKLLEKSVEKKSSIVALAKTTHVLTNTGKSLISVLRKMSEKQEWQYKLTEYLPKFSEDNKIQLFFVKLHKKGDYIFKLETTNPEIISLLKENSDDPCMFGYPYGLIEADKFARIGKQEKDYYRTKFKVIANKEWKNIKDSTNSINAHEVLDNLG